MKPGKRLSAMSLCLSTLGLAIGGQSAEAQSGQWEYTGTFYLFASETTTRIGPIETELSFSDALENLDLAFMGALEVSNGTWSFIGDYMYTDLTFSGGSPIAGFTRSETNVTTNIFSGYAGYRVFDDGQSIVDFGAGVRWYDTDTQISLTGGATTPVRSVGDDWIDPLIMVRARKQLNDRWSAAVIADYGGFSSDRETWQALLNFGYAITDRWTAQVGYRYIHVENDVNGAPYEFTQSGPAFGISYRF